MLRGCKNKMEKKYRLFSVMFIFLLLFIASEIIAKNSYSFADPIEACEFISTEEMEKIMGEKLNDPVLAEQTEGSLTAASFAECIYSSKYSNKKISIFFRIYPVAEDTPTIIEETKFTLAEMHNNIVEIDTLGEVSYWSGGELHVFTGGTTYFIVAISGLDDKSAFEKSIQAAELLIDRL
jgi:hypothetical protein